MFPTNPWEQGGLLRAMFTTDTEWVFPWYLNYSACGDSPSLGTGMESSLWEHRTFPTPNSGILAELLLDTVPPCCCLVQTPAVVEGAHGGKNREGLGAHTCQLQCFAFSSHCPGPVPGAGCVLICLLSAGSESRRPCRAETLPRLEKGRSWDGVTPFLSLLWLCRIQRAWSVIMRAVQASAWLRGAGPWC